MGVSFLYSSRSQEEQGFAQGKWLFWGLGAVVLLGWGLWFFLDAVPVLATSRQARVEVDLAVHPVASLVTGRVTANHMQLGKEVRAGEVLMELDAETNRLLLAETQARITGVAEEIKALAEEIVIERKAKAVSDRVGRVASAQVRKKSKGARARARRAEREPRRLRRLEREGVLSKAEMQRSQTESISRRAESDALRFSIRRRGWERRAKFLEHEVRLSGLLSDRARLEGELATLHATEHRLKHEIEIRSIRAPVDGRIAEMSVNPEGTVVLQGAVVGAVVPQGELRVVALFVPSISLGRIQPGQTAKMRLHGFPWVQYGTLNAQVTRVASEVREGLVRVELQLQTDSLSPIPLQHGLPGTVEVEVERITPAALALRTVGEILTTAAPDESAGPPPTGAQS